MRDAKVANRKGLFNHGSGTEGLYQSLKLESTADICILRRVGGIGDVLMMTPALRELKRRFPEAALTVGVDRHTTAEDIYYNLIENAPFIDHLVDARYVDRKKFYRCVDISAVCIPYERKGLPSRNRINLFANYLGLQDMEDSLPFYEVRPEEKAWANKYYSEKFPANSIVIALHTASNEKKRSWPADQMLNFIRYMKYHIPSIKFLVIDQNQVYDNWEAIPGVVMIKHSKVRNMAALIGKSDMFVGPDSGPMHIAGALQKKSVVVFGSIPPEARINHYKNHIGVRMDNLKCIGCWYDKCSYNFKCMNKLTGSYVGSIAKDHLLKVI
tara:strand:+ start:324 stop:1304 length:981 start_codon:yes stop_codon:yes gene_type:complete